MQVYVFVENTIQQKMLQQKAVEKSVMFHLYNLILFYSIEEKNLLYSGKKHVFGGRERLRLIYRRQGEKPAVSWGDMLILSTAADGTTFPLLVMA